MRIAYITAGAAGMYCGSCMHDNTLAAALARLGHDALLVPTYTPIRTDELPPDAADDPSVVMRVSDEVRDVIQAGLVRNLMRRRGAFRG